MTFSLQTKIWIWDLPKHKPGELIIQMYHLLWFILFTIESSGYCAIRKWYKLPVFKTIFLFPPVSPCFLLVLVLFIILQTQLLFTLTMNQSSEMSAIYRILTDNCNTKICTLNILLPCPDTPSDVDLSSKPIGTGCSIPSVNTARVRCQPPTSV